LKLPSTYYLSPGNGQDSENCLDFLISRNTFYVSVNFTHSEIFQAWGLLWKSSQWLSHSVERRNVWPPQVKHIWNQHQFC